MNLAPGTNSTTGIQGEPMTLTCMSTGGFPPQSVDWYRGSTTGSVLTNCMVQHAYVQTLYNVNKSCTITPTNDGETFFCVTSYSDAPQLVDIAEVTLRLESMFTLFYVFNSM